MLILCLSMWSMCLCDPAHRIFIKFTKILDSNLEPDRISAYHYKQIQYYLLSIQKKYALFPNVCRQLLKLIGNMSMLSLFILFPDKLHQCNSK
jgi:hypothetical protein